MIARILRLFYGPETQSPIEDILFHQFSEEPTGGSILSAVYVYCYLSNDTLVIRLRTHIEALIQKVLSILTWTISVLQIPQPETEGLFSWTPGSIRNTSILPKLSRFEPLKDARSYCWKELFKYAYIVYPPSSHPIDETSTEGLMIDFDILVDLAAVDRTMMTEDGPILFGFDTALIPLDPPESRRWHFLATDGRQITPARIKRIFKESRCQGPLNPQYCTGSVYVCWCVNPVVTLCTREGDSDLIASCSLKSGVPQSGPIEEPHERSKAKDINFLGRGGISTISFGISTARKSEQKWKTGPTAKKRKVEENFQGVLDAAQGLKSILWDQRAQKAWFLPAISGLLFTSLRYIEYNNYLFQEKLPDGQFRETKVSYAGESADPAVEAKLALKKNRELLVIQERGELSFGDIILKRWFGMEEAHDICCSDITGKKREKSGALPGYDLRDALFGDSIQLRWLEENKSIQCWNPLAQMDETRVIFCRKVGPVMTCKSSSERCFTHNPPENTLSCLLHSLDIPDIESPGQWFHICEGYKWVPIGFLPFEDTISATCSCNLQRLSKVQEAQPRKLQKRSKRIGLNESNKHVKLPDSAAIITFGV